ncbi:hypothetical protein ERJ75_001670500 [Trypanosoma vivax]|uniref:Uncharacterized protein n=1 Tax=Trypanosoma vivax (strain Y486) TaxID=1055687 RepID=G0U8M5_TRYVY|nr:hypothetical protein TRVL_03548 [Trypanosoma vivax]KAH8604938.1 hypothetical protein ERJ75_001670500 [Trypanosoma vivax]CCC53952.1 conserved hypothetical protein [Trypanosoma vivax Y486]
MKPEKGSESTPYLPDTNSPPDSPFITDIRAACSSVMPTKYVRRMEEALRLYALHDEQRLAYSTAYSTALWTVGIQSGWMSVAVWLAVRGYRFADPVQSLASGVTSNRALQRFFTPLPLFGLVMGGLTFAQLPADVRFLLSARDNCKKEEELKHAAMESWSEALAEGAAEVERAGMHQPSPP